MNVGPPREDSKAASSNSPPPVTEPSKTDLAKYEKEHVGSRNDEEDTKLSPKTDKVTKDTLAEPKEKPTSAAKVKKKKSWKKPEGMPKRPLSAYNLFFKEQRQELLGEEISSAFPVTDQTKRKHRRSHGKVGFQEMASIIGKKWKALSPAERKSYEDTAAVEKAKYKEKVERWRSGEDDVESGDERASLHQTDNVNMGAMGGLPRLDAPDLAMADLTDMPRYSSFGPGQLANPMLATGAAAGMGQHAFDRLAATQFGAGRVTTQASTSMIPPTAGLSDSGRMMPGGLGESGRMIPGLHGPMDSERMMLNSQGLSGDSEGDRYNHLQRMYEIRVREAALLREEMQRNFAQTSGNQLGAPTPNQGIPTHMGQVTSDTGTGGLLSMGQTNQQTQGLQPPSIGQRRMSLGTSLGAGMRYVPKQQHQHQSYPNDFYMFSPGGGQQQQLRQAEEAWQNQLALGSPGLSQMPQQQPRGTDPVTAFREQRALLLQQALESERAFRADEELQRLLRRQSGGPGGGR